MQRTLQRLALGGMMALSVGLPLRPATGAPPETIPAPQAAPAAGRWLGVNSCTARACHGNPGDDRVHAAIWGNEQAVWKEHDKHARAYAVLFEPKGVEIARKLGLPPAHEARECLVCHAPAIDSAHPNAALLSEGVGCEACHGAADKWLVAHTSAQWSYFSPEERQRDYGLIETKDLAARAERCAECHVGTGDRDGDGSPDRDMNHDMIAAGHPRLTFEMASHHTRMPAHWTEKGENDRRQGDFETRAWAIGQLVAARTQLELLAARADAVEADAPRAVWPELSEFNCFACHHELDTPSWRQQDYLQLKAGAARPKPGMPAWGSWQFSLLPRLHGKLASGKLAVQPVSLQGLQTLQTTMASLNADPRVVSQQAQAAAAEIAAWLTRIERARYDSATIRALQRQLAAEGQMVAQTHWDGAAQVYLALAALEQSSLDGNARDDASDQAMRQALADLRGALLFPPTVGPASRRRLDSPRSFEPSQEVPARLRDIENLLLR